MATKIKQYKTNIDLVTLKRNKTDFLKAQIRSSKDAAYFARQFYFDDLLIYESTFIILLNQSNNTIAYAKISQGGVCSTVIDASIIAKYAIDTLAKAVIMVHNHPSGNSTPSQNDITVTKKVKNTLAIFDCTLHDHIILTEDSYTSFADEGLI